MTTGFVSLHHLRRNIIEALWLEADRPILPNLARGGVNRANSASWGNSSQTTFSFVFLDSLHFCRCFPQLALRFRDSATFSLGNRSRTSFRGRRRFFELLLCRRRQQMHAAQKRNNLPYLRVAENAFLSGHSSPADAVLDNVESLVVLHHVHMQLVKELRCRRIESASQRCLRICRVAMAP